ncbi:MAG: hypothetical protein DMG59_21200 [Acidobacteria bacterium]|nr:MAG: hypothetical protein DMG59_21200 [Acidobacteriota bacterium]
MAPRAARFGERVAKRQFVDGAGLLVLEQVTNLARQIRVLGLAKCGLLGDKIRVLAARILREA